ncbi:TPA: hypothetical protein HA241_00995 [Candidatus Woesearchaeota archaeon]|nr:hypothetical protein [Candidatus Woesearchaeota archaeon]
MNLERKGMIRVALLVGAMITPPALLSLSTIFHETKPANTDAQSMEQTSFTGELSDISQYVKDSKFTVEATFDWTYNGDDISEPITTSFSLCQSKGSCYIGKYGKTLESLTGGTHVQEKIKLAAAGAVGQNDLVIGFMVKRNGEADYTFSDKYALPDN